MAKLTTAEFLLQRLHENGVRRVYGYPGDGINAIVGALARQKDLIEFVQVRHEEQAAFMACARGAGRGGGGSRGAGGGGAGGCVPPPPPPGRGPTPPQDGPLRREARPR